MTSLAFSSVDGDLLDELTLVADPYTPLGIDDGDRFRAACWAEALSADGWVDPNRVRSLLMVDGELQIGPRRYSALWSTACSRTGYLDVHRDRMVPISGAGSKHNGNKLVPLRKWRGWGVPVVAVAS